MPEKDHNNRKVYTLLEVTKSLQSVIRKTYTSTYWIKAEIAKLNFYPKSGHCYPDLVYKVDGRVKAEMRSIIWRNDFRRLNKAFRDVAKEELKDGMQILFRAQVNFHPKYSLSLNILDIEPAFTLGEMAREKAETISKLKKERVFMLNKQLPFPLLPKKLAVISVSTSKGYHDFVNILENNRYGFQISHDLFSALLQGDRCAVSIGQQLDAIESQKTQYDAVAIIRGGGGDVGLNAYDDLELSRRVARFPIPVISGIGHSTNETVVEMVAHMNKITPTDVAYYILGKFQDLYFDLINLKKQLLSQTQKQIDSHHQTLDNLQALFSMKALHFTKKQKSLLDAYGKTLSKDVTRQLHDAEKQLRSYSSSIGKGVKINISARAKAVAQISSDIRKAARQQVSNNHQKLATAETKIRLLDPQNILKRGYSLTYKNGKLLRNISEIQEAEIVTTKLMNGTFESEIKSKTDE